MITSTMYNILLCIVMYWVIDSCVCGLCVCVLVYGVTCWSGWFIGGILPILTT